VHYFLYFLAITAPKPNRILWMKAAAARYPYTDLTRIGRTYMKRQRNSRPVKRLVGQYFNIL
jgi:hypothetical protein